MRKFTAKLVLIFTLFVMAVTPKFLCSETGVVIHIRADGSIDPSSAPISTTDNITYVLTGKVLIGITVERDNIIIDGKGYSIQGTEAWGSIGITMNGRSNITICNLHIDAFWHGIEILYSSNIDICFNEITYHYDGIILISTSNSSIYGNIIVENYDDGIWIEKSTSNKICDNTIYGSSITTHDYGITLYESSYNRIERNTITNIEYGLGFQYSTGNNASSNTIKAVNQYGIWLQLSSNNSIYKNNFMNNTCHAYTFESTGNFWDNGLEGNYWDDYNGNDTNGDVIGDTAYIIDEDNKDHYPLMFPHMVPEVPFPYALLVCVVATLPIILYKRKS